MKKILIAGLILLILVVGSFAVMAADEDEGFFSKVVGFIALPVDDDLGIQKPNVGADLPDTTGPDSSVDDEEDSVLVAVPGLLNVLDTECNDGIDNDNDDKIDYGKDGGCSSALDTSEAETECNNGVDDDIDGYIDLGGCDLNNNGFLDTSANLCTGDNDYVYAGYYSSSPCEDEYWVLQNFDETSVTSGACDQLINYYKEGLWMAAFDVGGDVKIYLDDLPISSVALTYIDADSNCNSDPEDTSETPECEDEIDNDADGNIDQGWCDINANGKLESLKLNYIDLVGEERTETFDESAYSELGCMAFAAITDTNGNYLTPVYNEGDSGCKDEADDMEALELFEMPLELAPSPWADLELDDGYCNDGWDNDGDGFADRYGVCVDANYAIISTCAIADTLGDYQRCETDCEDVLGQRFYYPDAGCNNGLDDGEKNRCGDFWDNDHDGLTDYWGGCDIDADQVMDYVCGCDVNDDGNLDFSDEIIAKEDCDSASIYLCIDLGSGPELLADLTIAIDKTAALEQAIVNPDIFLQFRDVNLDTVNSCEGDFYLPDPECRWIGDDSERDL
ncbi:hypothetical protein HOE91_03090 [archaeon]|nr:hypothetical protein [archaeon]